MKFFDGLYPYQIVLMVLGVILFIALLLLLVVLAVKRRPFAKLLGFFVIPIIMIGFPGIKSFEFSQGVVKVETYTHDLERDPTNKTMRESLASELASLLPRPSSDPKVITTIAHAQIALARNEEARASFNKASQLAPQHPQVLALKERLELDGKLGELAAKVEQQPNNSSAKEELQRTVAEVSSRPIASPVTIVNIARAQTALGDQTQARSNVEKALKINPNLAQAIQLKSKLGPP